MKPRILFYCQHVLGMGHMVRSREIVKGLGEFDVCFVNGGEPVEGFAFPAAVRVVQLPPIRSDAAFLAIDATEAVKAERARILLALLDEVDPDVAVIEMFPFGRRKFAFELIPFLEEIRRCGKRTRVVSSVRDILVGKRDQARHEEQACGWLNEYFDLVMVHADPRFQQLGETFLRAGEIRCAISYTGFVAERCAVTARRAEARRAATPDRIRLIASAGGGRVGFPLLSAAIAASRQLATWLAHDLVVFTGPYLSAGEFSQLAALAEDAPWIRLERFAPDFVDQMAAADLLLSMAGYNTCMNILTTGIRALVLPFTGNQNEEQTIRARKLAALGLLGVLSEAGLEPVALAARISQALAAPPPAAVAEPLNLNGVAATAALLERVAGGAVAHV